jgi:hypothetical protein
MQRSPGATIGSYEIRSVLGKGGMGEVYLAHDRKLVRDVAVKTLPAEFAGDLERLARFQREARMLAALNHPNIAAIYGLEESEGDSFLVLELVGRDAGRVAPTQGAAAVERSAQRCFTDGGRTGGGPRQRDYASRHQARQYQDHTRRTGENPGLRAGQSDGRR